MNQQLEILVGEKTRLEVIREVGELIDFDFSDYNPEKRDYRKFLSDFSERISSQLEREILRHDKRKLLALVKGIVKINQGEIRELEQQASKTNNQDEYQELLKRASELGNSVFRNRYQEFRDSIGRNEEFKEFFGLSGLYREDLELFKNGEFDYEKFLKTKINSRKTLLNAMSILSFSDIPNFVNVVGMHILSKHSESEESLTENERDYLRILGQRDRTKKLDQILMQVARSGCNSECKRGTCGCCEKQHYRIYGQSKTLLALQEIEALKNGWTSRRNRYHDCCDYLNSGGCKLTSFKPMICISYLCTSFRYSKDYRESKEYKEFYDEMKNLYEHSLYHPDSPILTIHMDSAITVGEQLIASA